MLRSIFSLVLIFYGTYLFGQSKVLDPSKAISQYSLKVWSTEAGLPSISLTDMLQADNEYIWIATYNGLSRFDGVKFTNYTIDNVPSLHANAIKTLEYFDNTLWVGSHKGIVKYTNGVFSEESGLTTLGQVSIEDLKFDQKGRLFIGTTSEGLFVYENGQLRKLDNPLLERSPIGAIVEDKDGTVWIGSDKGDLFKYQGSDLRLAYNSEVTGGITTLYLDRSGVVWVAADNGFFTLTDGVLSKNEKLSVGGDFGDVVQDHFGDIWTTNNNGIVRYSHVTDEVELFSEDQGLPNNLVRKLMFDHQGNLWIASYRSGLFQLTDGIFTTYSGTEGLSGDVVTSIVEYEPNAYWIASEGGYIDVLKDGKLKKLELAKPLPSSRLKQLMLDSKGFVWVSTYGGLVKLDKSGKEQALPAALNGLDNYVRMTFEDTKGNIWIGTRRTGLYLLDWHGQLKHFDTKNGLSSNFIMSIDQRADGTMMIGTKNGINLIQNNKIIDLIDREDGLPTNFIFDIYEEDGLLWLGTDLGLCRYDEVGKKATLYNVSNGLNDNIVFDIATDSLGNLWLTSNSGVIQVAKSQLNDYASGKQNLIKVKLYNKTDGMKSEQCVGATKILTDQMGKLWIPTVMGVTSIYPNKKNAAINNFSTNIEDLATEEEVYLPFEDIRIEPGKGKRIQISFTAFDYIAPSKIKFKYKLEPFDEHWQKISDARHVDYTNLPPDNYVFKVKPDIANDDRVEPATFDFTIKAFFYETPLFYALCVLSFLLAVVFIYRYRLSQIKEREVELQRRVTERTREVVQQRDQIQQQNHKIEKAFEELKDTQMQLVESEKMASLGQLTAGIAHELNNPINFVFAGINSLKVQISDLLELAALYAKLDQEKDLDKIAQIQEEVKQLKYDLEFDDLPDDVKGLVQDIEQGAERTAEIVKSLRVFTRVDDTEAFQLTDIHEVLNSTLIILRNTYKDHIRVVKEFHNLPMVACNAGKMGQVFTNLIANAIDAIPEKGKITIETAAFTADESHAELEPNKEYVEVKIEDNGVGIAAKDLNAIFDPFFTTKKVGDGTGLGLSISKDIIEQHHGQIFVSSEVGVGTSFQIIIPVEQTLNVE
ncbi:MAG: two-component regulator propeller domain-containing protein [Flammeovirgaceae bacterium]